MDAQLRDDNDDGLFYRLQKENALLPPQVRFVPLILSLSPEKALNQ